MHLFIDNRVRFIYMNFLIRDPATTIVIF